MYCCVYLYTYVYVGVHVCVRMHVWVFSMYLYLLVCSVTCYSILDLFGEIRTSSPGRRAAARQSRTNAHDGRAGRSPDPRQVIIGDRHGGLLQYPGHPPMQSDSEEPHHSNRNGDSPGDDQIPQCECLSLSLFLSLYLLSDHRYYFICDENCWVAHLDYMFMCRDRRAWRWTAISCLFYMLGV